MKTAARLDLRHSRLAFGLLLSAFAFSLSSAFAAPTVTQIAAGFYYSLFVESDGSLWGMGDNSSGQLGLGLTPASANFPLQIVSSNVTAIAGGGFHSLFRKSGGSLWVMGYNFCGELGDGSNTNHYSPEQLLASGVTVIAGGEDHSLFGEFQSSTGSLWGMGANDSGELGLGTTANTNTPQQILSTHGSSPAVIAVAAGGYHSLFVKPGGSLWAMGGNDNGQLGDGTTSQQNSPEQIVSANVTAIAAGFRHSLFIKSDGSLWAMGNNSYGQLGDNSAMNKQTPEQVGTNAIAVAAGVYHSLFIKSDGSLWAMGRNQEGQLGDGTATNQPLPVMVVSSNVIAVAAGANHSLFIKSDGSLWAMGYNFYGQLGDGTYTNQFTPVQVVPRRPAITGLKLAGTNLILNGASGQAGRIYYTLMSTNIALSLNQWMPVATNGLTTDGDFTITATNAVSPGSRRQFYLLQLQN